MEIMKIPDKVWADVISGKISCEYESLAIKVILSRLRLMTKMDTSSETILKSINELKALIVKLENVPSTQNDLKKIIAKGGI